MGWKVWFVLSTLVAIIAILENVDHEEEEVLITEKIVAISKSRAKVFQFLSDMRTYAEVKEIKHFILRLTKTMSNKYLLNYYYYKVEMSLIFTKAISQHKFYIDIHIKIAKKYISIFSRALIYLLVLHTWYMVLSEHK